MYLFMVWFWLCCLYSVVDCGCRLLRAACAVLSCGTSILVVALVLVWSLLLWFWYLCLLCVVWLGSGGVVW